jgi:protein O-GlcNAc transferase
VPPPLTTQTFITFGCLNQFQKVSPLALKLWRQIMHDLPGSRLILHAPPGKCRDQISQSFHHAGVDSRRIEFIGRLPWPQYIATYQRIDVALDPFPYSGGITTCDALWMGVPVITLRGATSVGRSATSILGNLKLHELIAHSPEQYFSAARTLVDNETLLSQMRSSLRQRMRESPLLDAPQFARDIEAAFILMWSEWIQTVS